MAAPRWRSMPLISALERQRCADLCEFQDSLALERESQNSQGYTEKPCVREHGEIFKKKEDGLERETLVKRKEKSLCY